ncbi:MAG: HAMP domain-containing histidine kinase [Chloroflexi bacterium]|nr:HAMP domain-containing histidine kinase [Chloroflexota bacterium]
MRKIAVKLTLAFLLIGLTGAMLVAVILQLRTRFAFDQFISNRDQQSWAENLVEYYQSNGGWQGVADHLSSVIGIPYINFASRRDFTHSGGLAPFTLVGPDHTILVSSSESRLGATVADSDLQQAIPLIAGNQPVGWLILTPPSRQWISGSPEGIFLGTINSATLASAGVAALLALILGGLLAITLTRSLREMTEATNEFAQGKFGRQVKIRSKDELGKLASSFNKMSHDLALAAEQRRQMTADIAHDLRTPLSVLSGYAEALSDGKLPGSTEIYEVLYTETQHLSRLVEDLRMLSLVETGELPLIRQPTSPQALLERVAACHVATAQQKGVTLRVEAVEGLPQMSMDPERMAQVLNNLIGNALRYTPSGGEVTLGARQAAESGKVQLWVRDTGSGISPEDLPHVFDRFYRGDPARQQNGESGLGLAIARSIVEAHGGSLRVESASGQGATFTMEFEGGQ